MVLTGRLEYLILMATQLRKKGWYTGKVKESKMEVGRVEKKSATQNISADATELKSLTPLRIVMCFPLLGSVLL